MLYAFLFSILGCESAEESTVDSKDEEQAEDSSEDVDENQDETPLVETFSAQLEGYFTSEEQAATNPNYYAISLHACQIDAPSLGEHVLYIEQAQVGGTPYRQRLYLLQELEEEDMVQSSIYTLQNESQFVGYCANPDANLTLSAEDYVLREGCEVVLAWDGEGFSGATAAETCASSLNNASYATSIVNTYPDRIESWDQGWFDNGVQAWGAVDGPYIFIRQ